EEAAQRAGQPVDGLLGPRADGDAQVAHARLPSLAAATGSRSSVVSPSPLGRAIARRIRTRGTTPTSRPRSPVTGRGSGASAAEAKRSDSGVRSEEHTSELQSREKLVC